MGIQDRDYYREGPSFLDRVGQQGATAWLIAITVGVFFGQVLAPGPVLRGDPNPLLLGPLVTLGAFDPDRISDGEVWRLLTPVFLHAGLFHLFGNMLILYFTGVKLEERYGSREFVIFYIVAGIFANLVYLGAQLAGLTEMSRAVGASGAVTATLIVFAFNYPRQKVLLYFIIPMPVWLLAALWIGYDAIAAVGAMNANPNRQGAGIAYFAHLGGAAFGLLYYQFGIRFSRVFDRSPKTRARPKLRLVVPPVEEPPEPVGAAVVAAPRPATPTDEQLEAKLDAVLDKVSKHGPESLTPEEREIFYKAGELYKKRRK